MAVAAHVSRVSKEYAPFGYSIMESISVPFTLVAGTDVYIPLAYAEDADLYLEAASLVALTAFGSEGTNPQGRALYLKADAAASAAIESVAAVIRIRRKA